MSYGFASADFAVNRRVKTAEGYVGGVNPDGPVDHRVPLLVLHDDLDRIRALVFGYSCHNTTLQGDNYFIHGDYAGVAQQWLEKRYPESTAFFIAGTAGDANPHPRGTLELAVRHGQALARAVDRALSVRLKKVEGPLLTQFELISLKFAQPPTREDLLVQLESEDQYYRKHARYWLEKQKIVGRIPGQTEYPVQIWKFGNDLQMIALAGEVVVDYSIRLKRELVGQDLWIAGYSNDVSYYVPSRRILREGGYEAEESMIYYGQPGRFSDTIEETIVSKIKKMLDNSR
jgi:hypothetical protein